MVIAMSWITATIAPIAILIVNRTERYSAITKKKMTSARSALLLTCCPQVGPTSLTLTAAGFTPA